MNYDIQIFSAAIGGAIGWYIGNWDGFLCALAAFVIIDYITGIMCGINDKTLSSETGFRGICRKVLIFLLVGMGNILDEQIFHTESLFRTAVIFFYLANEGISITENAAHLGLPVPQKIVDALEQLKDNGDKSKEDNKHE